MLKTIEIFGFKSFADRTRLEFGGGISALVGPNGSGKSNIVDAIKWVLGEQSMKKLRSSESTDVIFNGSTSRQPLGSAEVTLTFDNSNNIFDVDLPEVHITRRVYRNGEGEYLINRQASRLKDIKEMLCGTGLGTHAYSIIEQGRVEAILQSSSVGRRAIFEEAAGVARFNAKKQETQKRLERVDQNLIRLSDIVNEVDHQLRVAKSQAGKAQLYRQYTNRLQELRIQSGLFDYRLRAEQYRAVQREIDELNHAMESMTAATEHHEKSLTEINTQIENVEPEMRRVEGEIAATREKIFAEETNIERQLTQAAELDDEIADCGRQLLEMNVRSVDTEGMMRKTTEEIRKAKRSFTEVSDAYQLLLQKSDDLSLQLKEKQSERNILRKEIDAKKQQQAKNAGAISGFESRSAALEHAKEQNLVRLDSLKKQRDELVGQQNELRDAVDNLSDKVSHRKEQLDDAKRQKSDRAKRLSQLSHDLSEVKQRQSAMRERISLLEELIQKHEGLSPGVKDVLQQSKLSKSPFRYVYGLVADLLPVEFASASLIEMALGHRAQYVVVAPEPELFKHIEKNAAQFTGRVSFIWLDKNLKETPWLKKHAFDGRPGVLGRADQFVKVDGIFQHLAYRLLGQTWIVENLSVAKNLYRESDDRTNFLTVSGELLTSDSALTVGPPHTGSGLITRRSELRTLSEQRESFDHSVTEIEIAVAVAKEQITEDENEVEEETREHQRTVTELESQKHKLSAVDDRLQHVNEQYEQLSDEIAKLETQILRTTEDANETKRQHLELETQMTDLERQLALTISEAETVEKQYAEHQKTTMNVKIDLAKSEERLESLKERARQFEEHLKERQKTLQEHERRSKTLKERREQILLDVLRMEGVIAQLYLKKESAAIFVRERSESRAEIADKRNKIQSELKKQTNELNKIRTKSHVKELESERLSQEQRTLIDRIQEDFKVDLVELDMQYTERLARQMQTPEAENDAENHGWRVVGDENGADTERNDDRDPAEYQAEIEDLRQKLQKMGSVNLEAIETLEELETRFTTLSNQYNDLMAAKKSIEKIIESTNAECRGLFEETFDGVRGHFQDLFRQLFGGGSADLVLEDPTNILESGIDIVAKPPGKELKSVALMSGGEKTLTCVALLMAFFRHRPNPVCILDEVDAALDEGNIERFTRVLKEFQTDTQFLVVSHNKKTISVADTIYGVTMQESGVSKSISVRFVDVGENGEILTESTPLKQAA